MLAFAFACNGNALLLALVLLRVLPACAQPDRALNQSASENENAHGRPQRQFLFFTSAGCTATAQPMASHPPSEPSKLYYQTLYEHRSTASTSTAIYLLVGARNLALNITIYPRFEVSKTTVWMSEEEDCERLIRTYVPASASKNEFLICDASKRQDCRRYAEGTVTDQLFSSFSRLSNEDRAAAHYSAETNRLYFAGSVDGFAQFELATAADLTHEQRIALADYIDSESADLVNRFFDAAKFNFYSLQESDDKLYLFFEEAAAEHTHLYRTQRPESRVARVAQICKGEPGFMPMRGIYPLMTTFRKIRLSCRIGGVVYESGVEYDSFVGTSRFGKTTSLDGRTETEVFYAAFNFANDYIRRAVVCAYDVASLRNVFSQHREHYVFGSGAPFKPLHTVYDNASIDLAQCDAEHPQEAVQFVRSHPLLTAVLNPIGWRPVFVSQSNFTRFTSITVDWQVPAADGKVYNVLYLGTSDGKVVKVAVNSETSHSVSVIDAFEGESIISLHLSGPTHADQVVSVTDSGIVSSPVADCGAHSTCVACVSARDVYCAWHVDSCKRTELGLSDVSGGNVSACPADSTATTEASTLHSDWTSSNNSVSLILHEPVAEAQVAPLVLATVHSSSLNISVLIVAIIIAVLIGLMLGYVLGVRAGFKPFRRLADRMGLSRSRVRYSPVIMSLSGRVKQRLFGGVAATNRCDSQSEQCKPSTNIDFGASVPKLNNLSASHEPNLYTTSTKPMINIYESVYENGAEDIVHADTEEDDAAHYADVIQSGSDSRASVTMGDESDEPRVRLCASSLLDKIVIDSGSGRADRYSGLRATYTANRSESSQTKSSNGTDGCTSPDVNDYDACLHVPVGVASSKRPFTKHVPNLFSTKLKGLLLDRFGSTSADTGSNCATSSSNSSVL